MRRIKKIGIPVFLCLLLSQHLSAQVVDTSKTTALTWDLQTCLDYAIKNNIQINTFSLDKQLSAQDLLLAKAAPLPNLTGSSSQSLTHSKNFNPSSGNYESQLNFASNYSLNSSVTLYNGGYLRNNIKQRNLLVNSADLTVQQAMNDITIQVTQSYLNILLAKENIIYINDLVATSQAQVEQAQKKYNAGAIARKDLLQLQGQLADDKYQLVVAHSAYRQNVVTLKQILQLQVDSFYVVAPDTLIATALTPTLKEAQAVALQVRPEIKNAELEKQISQLDLAKARAGYKPVIMGSGLLSTSYSDNTSSGYLPQLDNFFFQRVGITLSIPIFSNRINRTNVEKAKIGIQQSEINQKNTKTTLMLAIEQAYINVVNAQSQYYAAVEELKATQESYRIAIEQLKIGAISITELLLQKDLYVKSLQAYIQSKYSAVMSVKIYDFYTGVPMKL